MCRTLKPQELTAGKMITLSMYNFGKVSFERFLRYNKTSNFICKLYIFLQLLRACTSVFAVFSWVATKNNANN